MSTAKRPRQEEKPKLVLTTNAHDVLLGRGNQVNGRPGNTQFRELAQGRALEYSNCDSKLEKDAIARQLVKEIHSKGGRFLRTVVAENREGEQIPAYQIVDMETTLTKAKQTLRDNAAAIKRGPKHKRKEAPEPSILESLPPDPSSSLLMAQIAGYAPSSSMAQLRGTQLQHLSASLQQQHIQQAQQERRLLELLGEQRSILSSNLLPDSSPSLTAGLGRASLQSQQAALLEMEQQRFLAQRLREREILTQEQLLRDHNLIRAAEQRQFQPQNPLTPSEQLLLQTQNPLLQSRSHLLHGSIPVRYLIPRDNSIDSLALQPSQLDRFLFASSLPSQQSFLASQAPIGARLPTARIEERLTTNLTPEAAASPERKRKAPPKEPPQESPKKK